MFSLAIVTGVLGLVVMILIVMGLAMGMAASPGVKDAAVRITKALPNGAATVYASPGIDLGKVTSQGSNPGEVEFTLTAPAMNATEMPDAKTMIYSIMLDTVDPIDGSSVAEYPSCITQTGAGGVGCAEAVFKFKVRSDANRIVGVRAVGSASGNATTASLTLEMKF